MKLITIAKFLKENLTDNDKFLIERAQQCLDKGYITKQEAVQTIQETLFPNRYYL